LGHLVSISNLSTQAGLGKKKIPRYASPGDLSSFLLQQNAKEVSALSKKYLLAFIKNFSFITNKSRYGHQQVKFAKHKQEIVEH
jgi:hypothetical protein